jgi:hypothetical protein
MAVGARFMGAAGVFLSKAAAALSLTQPVTSLAGLEACTSDIDHAWHGWP